MGLTRNFACITGQWQRHWLVAVLVTASVLIAAACGGSSTTTDQDTAPAQVNTPVPATAVPATSVPTAIPAIAGQTFEFPLVPDWVSKGKYQAMVLQGVNRTNPGQWDVHSCGSLSSCLHPSSMQFNGLVHHDPSNPINIICDLCESWEVSPDGAIYTFKIREANWHDGQPVTAEDIKFSFDRITLPDAGRARTSALRTFYEYQSAKVLDEHTVEIPLKFPGPLFLINLSSEYMKMYPKHASENLSSDDANLPGKLIGSGPWKLKDFQPQVSIEYEKNADYFKERRPFFDGMNFAHIRDFNRLLAALQVGQAFTTAGPSIGSYGNENSLKLQEETDGRVQSRMIPDAVQRYLVLHSNKPPFDDPRMRRAVYLAIDRQEIRDVLMCADGYGCFGSQGTFLPQKGGFNVEPASELAQEPGWRQPKDQDFAEAKTLMAAAGVDGGLKVTLNVSSSPISVRTSELLAEQLRSNIGLNVTLEVVDRASYGAKAREGAENMDLGSSGVIITDPSDYLNQHFSTGTQKNPDNWTDDGLTAIIEAQAKERDPAARLKLFQDAVKILRKGESHWVPVSWGNSGALMDYRLQGYVVPESEQILKQWEGIWWDPDAAMPSP